MPKQLMALELAEVDVEVVSIHPDASDAWIGSRRPPAGCAR
jgi:hypothetical protein